MVTLEMIPLRSKMPHTGRVTLRYSLPTVKIDYPVDTRAGVPRIATTPQVEQPQAEPELETTARKGGEAR